MQEARDLTKELLDHHHDDGKALVVDDHKKCVELDMRQLQIRTLITGFKEPIAPQQQGGGGAAQSMTVHLMFRRLKLQSRREAALAAEIEASLAEPMEVATKATSEDAPAHVQVQVNSWQGRVFIKRDPSLLEQLATDLASFDETLRTATNPDTRTRTPSNYDKNQRGTAGQE